MDAGTKSKSSQIGRARQFLTEVLDSDGNSTRTYKCQVCCKELSGTCGSNLVSHFKSSHKQLYNDRIADSSKDTISTQRMKLLYSCVELVAVNGYPFSLLTSSGFRSALEHQIRGLQLEGKNLNISDPKLFEIKEKVREVGKKIKQEIAEEVKGKVISVLADTATRNGRAIFGMNIQYKLNGVLKVVTLGMRELKRSHTMEYLSDVACEILAEYQIDLRQALSITTDNGSNMLAMARDMENKLFGDPESDDYNDCESLQPNVEHYNGNRVSTWVSNLNPDEIDDEIAQIVQEFTDDDALDILLDEGPNYEALLEHLVEDLRIRSGNHHIFMQSIRCAAHTLQLAVRDALKLLGDDDINSISLCRLVAKFLRLQSTKNEMRRINLHSKIPALDVKTRWSSTYMMVSDAFLLFALF